jgi:hypothetical protein
MSGTRPFRMLARPPDDVPRDMPHMLKTFPGRRTFIPSNSGEGGRCSLVRRKRTPACSSTNARLPLKPSGAGRPRPSPEGPMTCHRARTRHARPVVTTRLAGASRAACGPCAVRLVSGVILRDDRGRNAAALAHLVTTLLRPSSDFRASLPAWAGPSATATASAASPACMIGIRPELLTKFLRMRRAHVDLVGSAVKGERNRLRPLDLTVVRKVADDRHLHLLSHESQPFHWSTFIRLQTYTRTVAFANSHHRNRSASSVSAWQGRRHGRLQ